MFHQISMQIRSTSSLITLKFLDLFIIIKKSDEYTYVNMILNIVGCFFFNKIIEFALSIVGYRREDEREDERCFMSVIRLDKT